MAGRGRKKRDIPVTGILAGVVVALLVCLGILVSMTMRQGRTEKEGQSAQKNVPETGRLVAASDDEEQTERMTLQTERMTSQAEGKQKDTAGETDGQPAAETEESESDVSDGQKDSPKAGAGTKQESGTEPEGENVQQNSSRQELGLRSRAAQSPRVRTHRRTAQSLRLGMCRRTARSLKLRTCNGTAKNREQLAHRRMRRRLRRQKKQRRPKRPRKSSWSRLIRDIRGAGLI